MWKERCEQSALGKGKLVTLDLLSGYAGAAIRDCMVGPNGCKGFCYRHVDNNHIHSVNSHQTCIYNKINFKKLKKNNRRIFLFQFVLNFTDYNLRLTKNSIILIYLMFVEVYWEVYTRSGSHHRHNCECCTLSRGSCGRLFWGDRQLDPQSVWCAISYDWSIHH